MPLSKLVTMFVAFTILFLLACILFGKSLAVFLADILEIDDYRPLLMPVFLLFMVGTVSVVSILFLIV